MAHARRLVALVAGLLAVGVPAPAQGPGTPFMRRPDIHGDNVVFSSEGDLWLGSLTAGTARRITTDSGTEIWPRFSPDGKSIAFTASYDGGTDIYVMSLEGAGMPKRLTWDPMGARALGWTPDGSAVLFRSRRQSPERKARLWSVPLKGGVPSLYAIPKAEHAALAPDGNRVAYVPVSAEWNNWFRYQGGQADDIWLADLKAKTFRRLTTDPGVDTTPIWLGEAIYFVSERTGVANLWKLDPATGLQTQVTHFTDAPVRYPETDGRRIVFQHGYGIALYEPETGQARDIVFRMDTDRIHARPDRVPVAGSWRDMALGPTGKRLLLEVRGQLVSAPADEGDIRTVVNWPGARAQYASWSPDGKQIAFVSDASGEEQIWVQNTTGNPEPRQVTKDHVGPLGVIRWSPTGEYLVTSDREMRILLVHVKTGAVRLVDQSDRGGTYDSINFSARFSPDGKWLTFTRVEDNWNVAVYLYEIATKKLVPITTKAFSSSSPAFDTNGKFLYFLSDRNLNPEPSNLGAGISFNKPTRVYAVALASDTESPWLVRNAEEGEEKKDEKKEEPAKPEPAKDTAAKAPAKKPVPKAPSKPGPAAEEKPADKPKLPEVKVDAEGIAERVFEVPVAPDRYVGVEPVDGRLLLLVGAEGTQLRAFGTKDPKKRDVTTILERVDRLDISFDRKKMAVAVGREIGVFGTDSGRINLADGKVDLGNAVVVVNPPDEWKQILNESWRIARDFFYAPNMHGVDWPAVRSKYTPWLASLGDRSELNEILGDLIAELNTGHAYVGGGATPPTGRRVSMGYLGADLEPDPSGKAYRIVKLFKGDGYDAASRSPLLAPGLKVKEGDYILAVGGVPVSADEDIQSLLVGTAGQVTALTVNSKPSLEGSRQVRIRPLASEDKARYADWVASRAEYVRRNGGENLGYVHIPDMGDGGLLEWAKQYYHQSIEKDGLVLDVRNNGGGWIQAMLLLQANSKPIAWFKPRYGAPWTRWSWGTSGHLVALCNENSGSNAEEFVDNFQRLKMGAVIGKRTWGGEVGSGGGYTLVDGGEIYIPNYAMFSPEGKWLVEGTGAIPDIEVDDDPNLVLQGKDPQLDQAIAYLKQKIAAEPVVRPVIPVFPDKSKDGSAGLPSQ
jgi:tricorn protease